MTVERTLTLRDGTATSESEAVALAGDDAQGYRLLRIPLRRGPLPAEVASATVRVVVAADNTQLTEPARYELRPLPADVVRTFLFLNPVGGLDTLTTTGRGVASLEGVGAEATRVALPTDAPQTPLRSTWQLDDTRKLTASTGWLSRAEQRWLQAFVLSTQFWELRAGAFVPVVVGKRQLLYSRDERKLQALSFEYALASEEANWEELR